MHACTEQGRAGFAAVVLRLDRLILDNQILFFFSGGQSGKDLALLHRVKR